MTSGGWNICYLIEEHSQNQLVRRIKKEENPQLALEKSPETQ
jgi:hypothetical protein